MSEICINCGAAATLKCPVCDKAGIARFFCNQACFKSKYSEHAAEHIKDPFSGYKFTGQVRPGKVMPKLVVPENIVAPNYSKIARNDAYNIIINGPEEIRAVRRASKIGREALDLAAAAIKPGITTAEIDRIVHDAIIERGAYPSPLGYRGFPKSCCISINEVICHGIPSTTEVQSGDIVNVDITAYIDGCHGDLSETFPVGEVAPWHLQLVEAAKGAMMAGIGACGPGKLYRDIGPAIQKYISGINTASGTKYSIVKDYAGHGIGRTFHGAPNIPFYGKNKCPGIMKPGHIFTIEPMINEKSPETILWPDNWTAVTSDGLFSAQFEHTILITEAGPEILTDRPKS